MDRRARIDRLITSSSQDGTLPSMFLFGVSYAVASLSCTIGPFLAVTTSTFRSESWLTGLGVSCRRRTDCQPADDPPQNHASRDSTTTRVQAQAEHCMVPAHQAGARRRWRTMLNLRGAIRLHGRSGEGPVAAIPTVRR